MTLRYVSVWTVVRVFVFALFQAVVVASKEASLALVYLIHLVDFLLHSRLNTLLIELVIGPMWREHWNRILSCGHFTE